MGDRGVEARWAEGTSPAERIVHDTLRLAVASDVRLLPQVMLRVGERGTAQEVEADLIVVGSHEHGLLHGMIVGSTAERILRDTPSCILVARDESNDL